jgi:DNA-binding response OmpR family regulator/predicted regulator of Ras-like GTPase activity (Roadblock/LC7/MglB family)
LKREERQHVVPYRILVVDDEPNLVKLCVKTMEREGFEARGTTSGAEAIAFYKSEGFDLALVDLKMPDVDGLKVLTSLRKYDPSAAVVIFTGYGTKEDVVEALRLGACEFLEKPANAKTLVATVRRVLERGDSAAVRGNLHSLSLAGIIQINCIERNQARVRLRHQGREGSLFFADGEVVHAELGSQVGEEVVYELLTWKDGDFELEMGVSPPKQTIATGWSGLLLEGMRRLDEEAAGLERSEAIEAPVGKGVKDEMVQELARALREIDSVVGAVLTARDGVVLASELEGDPQKEGAVAVFVGTAASQVGKSLALGSFEWGTVAMGKDTMLVLERPDYYVGLLLDERASPAIVASSAEGVLK